MNINEKEWYRNELILKQVIDNLEHKLVFTNNSLKKLRILLILFIIYFIHFMQKKFALTINFCNDLC